MKLFAAFILGAIGYGVYKALSATPIPHKKMPFFDPAKHPERHDRRWDATDESSWESFPASDPPATW
ncbi:MAG: hypothetical protein ABIR96_03550 [Bdellovibrionota bacterium]